MESYYGVCPRNNDIVTITLKTESIRSIGDIPPAFNIVTFYSCSLSDKDCASTCTEVKRIKSECKRTMDNN